jgi:DNA-binding response OmpR family regulator
MRTLKILVAEDDRTLLKLYDHFLRGEVFEKRFAVNGEEALKIYSDWDPDILVLDLMMPILSGYLVLKMIRELKNDLLRCVVISSSLSSKLDILDCVKIGIQGYLVKPLNWKELACIILDFYQKANPEKEDLIAGFRQTLQELQTPRRSEGQQLSLAFGKPLRPV